MKTAFLIEELSPSRPQVEACCSEAEGLDVAACCSEAESLDVAACCSEAERLEAQSVPA